MRSKALVLLVAISLSCVLTGCGEPAVTNSNTGNTAPIASNNPLETKTPAPEQTTNNAPTLTPVFRAYCDAWIKNDAAALRRVYSAATMKQFEAEMKEEKSKNLIEHLEFTDRVSGTPCEVTNEKIDGDSAVARIRSDKYPNGINVVFVKENGEWKLTNRSPGSITQTPANSAR